VRTGRRTSGFTLIEVIVVIAVISILAAMAVPYAVKILDQSREEATKKQMEEVHRAILGDPKGPTAGYLGDMGRLPLAPPPVVLTNLNTQGTQAGPTTGTLGVKYGWYGPYVKIGFSPTAYLVDGWGTTLVYNSPGAGQVTSFGPNRALGGGDDIIYPSSLVAPVGRLLVNLYVWRTDNTTSQYVLNPQPASFPPMQMDVRMYYSANGVEAFKSYAGTPPLTGPPYTFSPALPAPPATPLSTHAGFHAVTATCTLPPNPQVRGQAVVYIPENNQQTQVNLYLR
jgi:prepilin-type N-terminal cleavage/methylation domain-containing protein